MMKPNINRSIRQLFLRQKNLIYCLFLPPMKKIISVFSITVISLFVLAVFGWMSVHISKGDKDFGFANEPIKFMYSFLDQFNKSVKEVENLSATFLPIWNEFEPINKLESDLKILVSYSESNSFRAVAIRNLKNDSIEYKWSIPEKAGRWDRVVNPYVLDNKDLVYFYTDNTGLRRIDSTGNFKWKQDSVMAHHSLNVDSAGNFWACTKNKPKGSATASYKIDGRTVYYDDDYITLINAQTGDMIFHKSVSEILKSNRLNNYILQAQTAKDPLHLNDIQPALKTTKYYNEGDVFLSIKQSSILLHYRPETNKVLKVLEGPFSAQHDIDFYNDSVLTIFNNNSYPHWTTDTKSKPASVENLVKSGNFYSNIVRYDFASGEYSFIGDSLFRDQKLFSSTEGLHEFINDSTYFIEEQNNGIYWVVKNEEVIYKDVFRSLKRGYCHLPNWARVIH